MTIDQSNVRVVLFRLSNRFIGDNRNGDNADILPAAGNLGGKQVRAEHVDVSDEDADPFSRQCR